MGADGIGKVGAQSVYSAQGEQPAQLAPDRGGDETKARCRDGGGQPAESGRALKLVNHEVADRKHAEAEHQDGSTSAQQREGAGAAGGRERFDHGWKRLQPGSHLRLEFKAWADAGFAHGRRSSRRNTSRSSNRIWGTPPRPPRGRRTGSKSGSDRNG